MKKIGLIFPHQLFKNHPVLEHTDEVFLIEDSLFFGDKHNPLNFHKLKLAFHRASMKEYEQALKKKTKVTYIEYDKKKTIRDIVKNIGTVEFFVVDPTDYLLEKRLKESCDFLRILPTPLFINTKEENATYLEGRTTYFMHHFYQHQRKRLDILMTQSGKPVGGTWSFDNQNRKRLPKTEYAEIPKPPRARNNQYISEAKAYIEKNFKNNPGNLNHFIYPTNHAEAEEWFQTFLKERFKKFGPYEDAITQEHYLVYHSLLSPLLNIGLLNPKKVIEETLAYAEKHNVPINSLEGFIRQIIGWREYMRMVYETLGTKMRKGNAWKHNQNLSPAFYDGSTGITPIDTVIQTILETAYCHHIERLMVLGNFMFLSHIHPTEIYKWFMELFIDAYDWVMVPNVYAMSQDTNQGIITTKPYISGSNYILTMSDYKKGEWSHVWDALFWNFVHKHKKYLKENARMNFIVAQAEKMTPEKIQTYEKTAKEFYKSLQRK